jgi:hypothetical protein
MIQTDEDGNWIRRPPLTKSEQMAVAEATKRVKAWRKQEVDRSLAPWQAPKKRINPWPGEGALPLTAVVP